MRERKRISYLRILVPLLCLGAPIAGAPAFPPPPMGRLATLPGTCAFTTLAWVGQRLGDGSGRPLTPSPGSAVTLANGVRGVSYDDVPAIQRTKVGDRVMTCLAKLPAHCPPGDRRGKWYATSNLRTNEAWLLPDAEHMCGGA